jgi:hypothetical protein
LQVCFELQFGAALGEILDGLTRSEVHHDLLRATKNGTIPGFFSKKEKIYVGQTPTRPGMIREPQQIHQKKKKTACIDSSHLDDRQKLG